MGKEKMIFESHTHLDDRAFDEDREEVIAKLKESEVKYIMNISAGLDSVKSSLELAKKYGKTPAQICLRFCLQSNILPLPKASSPERMKENLDIFDFDLSLEDVFRLTTMPETGWSGQHPEHF